MAESALIRNIEARLSALGKTAHGASLEANGSPSLIPNILNGRSHNPRGDTLQKIAAVLETTVEDLLRDSSEPREPQRPSEVRPADVPVPTGGQKNVPVYGTVAGSELGKGAFQLTSDVVDWVRRPAGLEGALDAYALYVEGESMVPVFPPGRLIFVHPHRKVLAGDYVVVQEPDSDNGSPRGFVKEYVRQTAKLLLTRQLNPAGNIDFVLRPGLVWHKVMTDNDLYGV